MADAIAQPSGLDEEVLILMRIKGIVAQIKRRETYFRQGQGLPDYKNISTAADLYERIERLSQQLGSQLRCEVGQILFTLRSHIPTSNPYSPPARLLPDV